MKAKVTAPTPAPKPPRAVAKRETLPNKSEATLPDDKEETPKEADNSLQLLTGPPTSLRTTPPAPETEAAQTKPSLTTQEVVDLADGSVRSHGVDPAEFQRGDAKFNAQDGTWNLPYGRGGGDAFRVTIDDKTKGTVFVPVKQ